MGHVFPFARSSLSFSRKNHSASLSLSSTTPCLSSFPRRLRMSFDRMNQSASPSVDSLFLLLSSMAPRLSSSPRRLRLSAFNLLVALLDGSSTTPPLRFLSLGGSPRWLHVSLALLDDSTSPLLISRWLSSTTPPLRF